MLYGDVAHYLYIGFSTTTKPATHRTYMYTFETALWWKKILNGFRIKTVAMKSLQMITASPLALNAILLKSKWKSGLLYS